MKLIERLGLAALHKFDPETSHGLSIAALKSGLAPVGPGDILAFGDNGCRIGFAKPHRIGRRV